jgi:SAM-dependent methyltransferase
MPEALAEPRRLGQVRVVLPRIQAFEFNDHPRAPAALRATIVEALSLTLEWGGILRGLAPVLSDFLERAGTRDVLDLGSGGGGPAKILAPLLRKRGWTGTITLTDLFPHAALWSDLAAKDASLRFETASVDATAIPKELSQGRTRTIINVLHHLPPPVARGVIEDAVRSRAPLFIAEGFERNPLRFLPFAPAGVPALFATPLFAPSARAQRIALTWLSPIALVCSVWDGVVSTLRVYSEAELRAMVPPSSDDPSTDYTWRYGQYHFAPFGRGYYFCGLPSAGTQQRRHRT